MEDKQILIRRTWAMPNKETFKIKEIAILLQKYVGDGFKWIDPFAGNNSPAEFTNDLNPLMRTKQHLHASSFIKLYSEKRFRGCLFDPPYSLRQMKEQYNSIGIDKLLPQETKFFFSKEKDVLANMIEIGGWAISFGWNSNGFGISRGFEIIEILIIAHGGNHNDTIVVVEQKVGGKS